MLPQGLSTEQAQAYVLFIHVSSACHSVWNPGNCPVKVPLLQPHFLPFFPSDLLLFNQCLKFRYFTFLIILKSSPSQLHFPSCYQSPGHHSPQTEFLDSLLINILFLHPSSPLIPKESESCCLQHFKNSPLALLKQKKLNLKSSLFIQGPFLIWSLNYLLSYFLLSISRQTIVQSSQTLHCQRTLCVFLYCVTLHDSS